MLLQERENTMRIFLNVNIYFHQTVHLPECNLCPKGLCFLCHIITRVYFARGILIESCSYGEKDNQNEPFVETFSTAGNARSLSRFSK